MTLLPFFHLSLAFLPVYSDHLVNLRLTSKQMVRGSKKCESSEKEAKTKLKKAIEARNTEGARIYAQVLLLVLHLPHSDDDLHLDSL
jgi:hypothetical protein